MTEITMDNYKEVSKNDTLSAEFLMEFKEDLDWYYLSRTHKFSEEFLEEHKDDIEWYYLSHEYELSEEFIEKMKDYYIGMIYVHFRNYLKNS